MQLQPACYRHPTREATIRCQRCTRPICTECMNDAAVGFQCPDCVTTGRRETRQNVGPYGGTRSSRPALTSQVLIGLNAIVWLAILATGGMQGIVARLFALTPQGICVLANDPGSYYPGATEAMCVARSGVVWHDGVSSGAFWQVITNAFTHIEIWHIAFNMLAIWFLGPQLEAVLGRARFLALYLLSALSASALVMWFSDPASPTLGASGAVFGLMGAILVIAHKHHGDVRGILVWLGANVAITFLGSGISWQGHLGGLLGGLVIAAIVAYAPKQNRTTIQWVGLAAFALVTLAAIAIRALQLA